MKLLIQWSGILVLSITLIGCNTMRGFGKDVQSGGEKVEGVATDTQKKM